RLPKNRSKVKVAKTRLPIRQNVRLRYSHRVAYAGNYNSVPGLGPRFDRVLDAANSLVYRQSDLLGHLRDRFLVRHLHDNSDHGNAALRSALFNVVSVYSGTADCGANAFCYLSAGLSFEL